LLTRTLPVEIGYPEGSGVGSAEGETPALMGLPDIRRNSHPEFSSGSEFGTRLRPHRGTAVTAHRHVLCPDKGTRRRCDAAQLRESFMKAPWFTS
jgi:hypothetical protein